MTSQGLIEALYRIGKANLSHIEVSPVAFEPFAARALDAAGSARSTLHAEDLYLACACSQGNSAAIALFGQRYADVLRRMAHRAQAAGVNRDDFLQEVRARLFVGDTSTGGSIHSYSATGPLGGWLRVVAARIATELIENNARVNRGGGRADETWSRVAAASDVELSTMRSEMRDSFQQAIYQAANQLTPEDRALLRQFYVHKVGVDGIAKLLGVHRSNASRAVACARASFLKEIKRLVGEQLGLADSSLNSAFGLMRSDIALNLGHLLQSTKPPNS